MERGSEKVSLGQRWTKARPTKTLVFWLCVACAALTMIVGFTWGGWVRGATARSMAEAGAEEAVVKHLAVKSQQIVLGDDPGDRRLALQGAVAAMPIVVVQPAGKRRRPVGRGDIRDGVGPLAEQGLDEALGLAIGAGRVGTREALGEAAGAAQGGQAVGPIGRPVVREDALHDNAASSEPGEGAPQKAGDGDGPLIRQDFGVGHAGAIINADVDKLPADAARPGPSVPGDAMADPADAAQLLDVEMEQLPRLRPFIPPAGGDRLRRPQPRQPELAQAARHRGPTQADTLRDLRPRPTPPTPQPLHLDHEPARDRAGRMVGPARPILQGQLPLRRPPGPLPDGAIAQPEAARDRRLGFAPVDACRDQGSTVRGGSRILMNVHPERLLRVDGRLATTTFAETLRLDNLLRLHT